MKDGSIQLDKIGGEIMQVMNSLAYEWWRRRWKWTV